MSAELFSTELAVNVLLDMIEKLDPSDVHRPIPQFEFSDLRFLLGRWSSEAHASTFDFTPDDSLLEHEATSQTSIVIVDDTTTDYRIASDEVV
ncbi:MAG: hypothetical protein QME66_04245 [Candidatus Eisenbacteria bacterium]|nr:hypothetical protein [Candidatus Eisenbacteria bacterium]